MVTEEMPSSIHFRIERLTDGVYAAMELPGGGGACNAGIIDLGNRTVVFDTFQTPEAAAELRQAAETLTGRSVSLVINSHFHADHTLGNQAFGGIPIISTSTIREVHAERNTVMIKTYREEGPAYLVKQEEKLSSMPEGPGRDVFADHVARTRLLVKAAPKTELVLPDVLVEDRLVLTGSRRRAELLALKGHTTSDVICWLPDDKLCFVGDLVLVATHPWMGHGLPDEWFKTLDRLEELEFERLVPGHGEIGGVEWIGEVRKYLKWVMLQAEEEAAKGTAAEEAAKLSPPGPYDQWSFPTGYGWNMSFLVGSLTAQRQE